MRLPEIEFIEASRHLKSEGLNVYFCFATWDDNEDFPTMGLLSKLSMTLLFESHSRYTFSGFVPVGEPNTYRARFVCDETKDVNAMRQNLLKCLSAI